MKYHLQKPLFYCREKRVDMDGSHNGPESFPSTEHMRKIFPNLAFMTERVIVPFFIEKGNNVEVVSKEKGDMILSSVYSSLGIFYTPESKLTSYGELSRDKSSYNLEESVQGVSIDKKELKQGLLNTLLCIQVLNSIEAYRPEGVNADCLYLKGGLVLSPEKYISMNFPDEIISED